MDRELKPHFLHAGMGLFCFKLSANLAAFPIRRSSAQGWVRYSDYPGIIGA
jgi:hypothetical protein